MKKRFLLLFVVIVLTACSNKKIHYDYTFKGEGVHWKVKYSISGTEILKELSSMRFLEYSYETSTGGGNGKREFYEPPTEMTFTFSEGVGNEKVIEADEVMQITIKWNGYEESFDLQNVSSSSIELNSSVK